jgi:hypothetical protein
MHAAQAARQRQNITACVTSFWQMPEARLCPQHYKTGAQNACYAFHQSALLQHRMLPSQGLAACGHEAAAPAALLKLCMTPLAPLNSSAVSFHTRAASSSEANVPRLMTCRRQPCAAAAHVSASSCSHCHESQHLYRDLYSDDVNAAQPPQDPVHSTHTKVHSTHTKRAASSPMLHMLPTCLPACCPPCLRSRIAPSSPPGFAATCTPPCT